MNPETKLAIIHVDDPTLCFCCQCAKIAEVEMSDGTVRKMFYCSRLDCDNWVMGSAVEVG